jgi:hypothetical protein
MFSKPLDSPTQVALNNNNCQLFLRLANVGRSLGLKIRSTLILPMTMAIAQTNVMNNGKSKCCHGSATSGMAWHIAVDIGLAIRE